MTLENIYMYMRKLVHAEKKITHCEFFICVLILFIISSAYVLDKILWWPLSKLFKVNTKEWRNKSFNKDQLLNGLMELLYGREQKNNQKMLM